MRVPTAVLVTVIPLLVIACESTPAPQRPTVASAAPSASAAEDTRPMRVRYPPGGRCTNVGRYICDDDRINALFCNAGIVEEIPCRGTKGCEGAEKTPTCDDDIGKLGESCLSATNENYACATDRNSALVCRDAKFQLWRVCKGPNHCQVLGDKVVCDNSIGDVGDPCGTPGTFVCSIDHKMLLTCQSETLVAANSCRGPKECRLLVDNKNHCDNSQAQDGDPCDTPDEVTCSMDGKSELICRGSKYAVKQKCKRKDGCVVRDGQLLCTF